MKMALSFLGFVASAIMIICNYSDTTKEAGLLVELFAARFNLSKLKTKPPFSSNTPFSSQIVNLLLSSKELFSWVPAERDL